VREAEWLRVAGENEEGGTTMMLASGTLNQFACCYGQVTRTERGELSIDAKAMEMLNLECGDRVLAVAR